MHLRPLAVLLVVGGLVGCGQQSRDADAQVGARAEAPAAAASAEMLRVSATQVKPLERKKFGAAITERDTTALDDLVKTPEKYASKTIRTQGTVSAVCQNMGCWMEIADDSGKVHVKMAGHAFFVPKDSAGHHAIVQGTVLTNDKDHCTEEAAQATGSVAKVEIEANAVEFMD